MNWGMVNLCRGKKEGRDDGREGREGRGVGRGGEEKGKGGGRKEECHHYQPDNLVRKNSQGNCP